MIRILSLLLITILLFSCKKDEACPPIDDNMQFTRIQVNDDFEIIEDVESLICENWINGVHNSRVSFSSNLVVLTDANVSFASIKTSSAEDGIYDIVDHQEFRDTTLPSKSGTALIQVYKDTVLLGENDHYVISSGKIEIKRTDDGRIIKCIPTGKFTSITDDSKSFDASITIACDN